MHLRCRALQLQQTHMHAAGQCECNRQATGHAVSDTNSCSTFSWSNSAAGMVHVYAPMKRVTNTAGSCCWQMTQRRSSSAKRRRVTHLEASHANLRGAGCVAMDAVGSKVLVRIMQAAQYGHLPSLAIQIACYIHMNGAGGMHAMLVRWLSSLRHSLGAGVCVPALPVRRPLERLRAHRTAVFHCAVTSYHGSVV